MGDSIMAVSIIGVSGFAEYDIMGDSFISVSIVGYSRFLKYDIMRDSPICKECAFIGGKGAPLECCPYPQI
jgi:hypothetical protein